jgi:hypothetical protein
MLPDSQKGYAPVVRGIARTNAQVVVRQNGYIIYQTYVAPGAQQTLSIHLLSMPKSCHLKPLFRRKPLFDYGPALQLPLLHLTFKKYSIYSIYAM